MIRKLIKHDLLNAFSSLGIEPPETDLQIEPPQVKKFGDFSTNCSMQLAKTLKQNPRQVAARIVDKINRSNYETIDIAGPGFINFTFKKQILFEFFAQTVVSQNFWKPDIGNGQKVLIEFVSANPTGPLHVGHGRGAVIGDVLTRVLKSCGYDVKSEYYVNNIGNQMRVLGESLFFRYLELHGKKVSYPEHCYQGDYIKDIARQFLKENKTKYIDSKFDDVAQIFIKFVSDKIMSYIKNVLKQTGVEFDRWFLESELYDNDFFKKTINELKNNDYVYEQDDKLYFAASRFEDEEDRVIIRDNGIPTYFASDVAYHKNKFERGFDRLINIWGADHHGYIPRMRGAIKALGYDPEQFVVLLIQFVRLFRGEEIVSMSTRSGSFISLQDVLNEVGKDATRFFFLQRGTNTTLNFDLELAKKQNPDNPVFYVQYGHARICSILEKAETLPGINIDSPVLFPHLELFIEKELALKILEYPIILEDISKQLEPHRLIFYLIELIKMFHGYYSQNKKTNKILSDNNEKTNARIFLVKTIKQVVSNALDIIGISAPEKMYP